MTFFMRAMIMLSLISCLSLDGVAAGYHDTLLNKCRDTTLYVSNTPESIKFPGVVFEDTLYRSQARVLYHHKNISTYPLVISFLITNTSSDDVILGLYEGKGGPTTDIVYAGHRAAVNFMESLLALPKKIIIPAQSTIRVVEHLVKPGSTTSGIIQIEKTTKTELTIKMQIEDPAFGPLSTVSNIADIRNAYLVGKYSESIRSTNASFDALDQIQRFSIGGKPYIRDDRSNIELKGSYGMIHTAQIVVTNSDIRKRKIQLFVEPTKKNAVDRAVLYLNGKLIQTGMLTLIAGEKISKKIFEFEIDPFGSRVLEWVTLPQAGCFYPVDYIIKTVD